MTNMTRICMPLTLAITVSALASPQLFAPDSADGDEWSIYTVDSSGRIRGYISIALDRYDHPHISYYREIDFDPLDGDLKYAKWVGDNWNIETVDFEGDVGAHNSLALDSSDHPHIAYFDSTDDDLMYTWWNGSAWNKEIVDSAGYVGEYTSIALDSHDYPHISYQAQIRVGGVAHYDLRHAWWNGSAWNIETVDTYTRFDSSIALDSCDFPHISYYSPVDNDVKYARWTGSAWSIEVVDSPVGDFSSLALDSHDFPHIGYHDGSSDDLKYARWNGSVWGIETVDSVGRVGMWVSIALDSLDHPHMSYLSGDSGLRYAGWNGTTWSFEIVDPLGGWSSTSMAIGNHDYPHIGYQNVSNDSLKYATKASLQRPRVSLNIDPDTLNLISKGRWITAYLTTENAKAEDINASSLLLNDAVQPEWWDIQNDTTLMVKFDRATVQSIVPVSDSVDIKVTGLWMDGVSFEAHDTIRVINPGRETAGIITTGLPEGISVTMQEPPRHLQRTSIPRYSQPLAGLSPIPDPGQKMHFRRI